MTYEIKQLESIARQLEPDINQREQLIKQVTAYSQAYLEGIGDAPANYPFEDGRIFISSTRIDGKFVLRLAISSFRTHLADIDEALDVLKWTARQLAEQ